MDTLNHRTARHRARAPRPALPGKPTAIAAVVIAVLAAALMSTRAEAASACSEPGTNGKNEVTDPAAARLQLVSLVAAAQKRSQSGPFHSKTPQIVRR